MDLPSGTVTFLFSDVEGSTQLLERDPVKTGRALARHHELFARLITEHHGAIFETVGDAVYAAFAAATDAVAAALSAQRALAATDWGSIGRLACRIALHTGDVERRGEHYFGPALFRCARLEAIGYGEQILLSGITANLVGAGMPDGASLRDLGQHRLKDLGEPEHVFMLVHPDLRDRFPAPRSLDLHPNNLPSELSSFVGREADIRTLRGLMEEHRLVTVLGPGGIGKTRLALQAAAEASDRFSDGVFFVELSGVIDPTLALPAIAATLGVREAGAMSLAEALTMFLETRQILLVLDNLEHLVDAAADIGRLLTAHRLRILATSRMPLHLRGEQRFEIPPLDISDTGGLSSAVRLFEARATELDPRFHLTPETTPIIIDLCRRLDGMPLAIELAAGRTRALSPRSLLDQISRSFEALGSASRDQPQRQRTMSATISWSLDGAGARTRQAFATLGIFAGGFTARSAEAIMDSDVGAAGEVLEELLDRSLIRLLPGDHIEDRYAMYEPIRDVAQGLLAGDIAKFAERHTSYFTALAEELEPAVRSNDPAALARLTDENDNIRGALATDFDTARWEQAARLGAALAWFWVLTGNTTEGYAALRRAVSATELPRAIHARALVGLGAILVTQGRPSEAAQGLQHAVAMTRKDGDAAALAFALNFLGRALSDLGDLDKAEAAYREGLAAARSAADLVTEMWIHNNRGIVSFRRGDVDGYEGQLRMVADLAARLGDQYNATVAQVNLAEVAAARGDLRFAESQFRELLASGEVPSVIPYVAAELAVVLALQGRLSDAALAASDALQRSRGEGFAREALNAIDVAAFVGAQSIDLARRSGALLAAAEAYRTAHHVLRDPVEQRLASQVTTQLVAGRHPPGRSQPAPRLADLSGTAEALVAAARATLSSEDAVADNAGLTAHLGRRSSRPV